jgi:hypothetical protein
MNAGIGYYVFLGLLHELNRAVSLNELARVEAKISDNNCYYSDKLRERLAEKLEDLLKRS